MSLDCGQQTKGEGWVANKWYLGRFFWKGGQKNLIKKVTTFYENVKFLVSLNFHEPTNFREPTFHEFKFPWRKRYVQGFKFPWTNEPTKSPLPAAAMVDFKIPFEEDPPLPAPLQQPDPTAKKKKAGADGLKTGRPFRFFGGWVG